MKELQNIINTKYNKTSLEQMSNVQLLNRTDTKFILNIDRLNNLLDSASEMYDVLEINGEQLLNYNTQYYDTPNFQMYKAHQNKKLNRFKIRQREYLISNIGFMEVKFKSNKGRTDKSRFQINGIESELSEKSLEFITDNSFYRGSSLVKSLLNRFSRITLVHKMDVERVTIDFNLDFRNESSFVTLPYLSIVEVKREGYARSDLIDLLKENRIYKKSFSKYSIGTLLLNPNFKGNSFKKTLLTLKKIENYV